MALCPCATPLNVVRDWRFVGQLVCEYFYFSLTTATTNSLSVAFVRDSTFGIQLDWLALTRSVYLHSVDLTERNEPRKIIFRSLRCLSLLNVYIQSSSRLTRKRPLLHRFRHDSHQFVSDSSRTFYLGVSFLRIISHSRDILMARISLNNAQNGFRNVQLMLMDQTNQRSPNLGLLGAFFS